MSAANKTNVIKQFLSDNDMRLDELKLCVDSLVLEDQVARIKLSRSKCSSVLQITPK